MSYVLPFAGIRYATDRQADVSSLLSPPYDVLSEADRQALLARSPDNFVLVDLPHTPPKHAGPPEVYERARRQLQDWLSNGRMLRDAAPAIYVYYQAYTHAGRAHVRKMFFARLRLEPFGAGSVFPHEQTFGGPKEDRLALMKATAATLSPIFGLYPDPENTVAARLAAAIGPNPLVHGTLDAVENRLWAVTDPTVISEVRELMASRPTFIADGHHRYGTAMLYRAWLAQREGPLPVDHPANYVMCVFCAMEDPGLLILPTHRVVPGVAFPPASLKGDADVEIAHLPADGADDVPARLEKFGPQAVGMFSAAPGAGEGFYVLRPWKETLLDGVCPERSAAWRRLGLAFLHAWLLDRVIGRHTKGQALDIHYVKSASAAVQEARDTGGCCFLMQPTTMKELGDVCTAGDLMPQKSTYFFPKLASGLVVSPLTA